MKVEVCESDLSFIWSTVIYMRHVQLKHIWGCSQLKALQPLKKKVTTGVYAGVS
jgi:hypothetical protein